MPLYEFTCRKCGVDFEELIRSKAEADAIRCSTCRSKRIVRKFSVFGLGGSSKSLSGGSSRHAGSSCGSCSTHRCGSCRSH